MRLSQKSQNSIFTPSTTICRRGENCKKMTFDTPSSPGLTITEGVTGTTNSPLTLPRKWSKSPL
jgi:hypothetical protein